MKSVIKITTRLKVEVLDPEAKTILNQLQSAGYLNICELRQEKNYILHFSCPIDEALLKSEKIANDILCNVSIHEWEINNITT